MRLGDLGEFAQGPHQLLHCLRGAGALVYYIRRLVFFLQISRAKRGPSFPRFYRLIRGCDAVQFYPIFVKIVKNGNHTHTAKIQFPRAHSGTESISGFRMPIFTGANGRGRAPIYTFYRMSRGFGAVQFAPDSPKIGDFGGIF